MHRTAPHCFFNGAAMPASNITCPIKPSSPEPHRTAPHRFNLRNIHDPQPYTATQIFCNLPSSQIRSLAYRVCCALQTFFRNPSRCANRLMQSSPSDCDRTNPHSAYVWFSPVYRPFSSTLPMEICTEAWSLALMMRFVAEHLRGT